MTSIDDDPIEDLGPLRRMAPFPGNLALPEVTEAPPDPDYTPPRTAQRRRRRFWRRRRGTYRPRARQAGRAAVRRADWLLRRGGVLTLGALVLLTAAAWQLHPSGGLTVGALSLLVMEFRWTDRREQ